MISVAGKATVALGPVRDYPSWHWIGPDMARELSRHYQVTLFEPAQELPPCDVAIIVKRRPTLESLRPWLDRKVKIVFLPVDIYQSESEIEKDEWFLQACTAILFHSSRLCPYLLRHSAHVWPIDHHNKFGLETPASFKPHGPILWIGDLKYVPYALHWAETNRHPHPIVLLTNVKGHRPSSMTAALGLAQRLGVDLSIQGERINGCKFQEWSVDAQREGLVAAKAAFDIKQGQSDFNQFTKPPTKAQKFIASGIPFASNAESYAFDYFQEHGFALCTLEDFPRWFSVDYWRATQEAGARLKNEITEAAVGRKLRTYVDRVLAWRSTEKSFPERVLHGTVRA
jgi:hypothetical protein